MRNQFRQFNDLVKMLPLEEQIIEIKDKINEVRHEIVLPHLTNHGYRAIKELKHMKQILLNSLNGRDIILQQ